MIANLAPSRKAQQSRPLSGFLALFGLPRYKARRQYYRVQSACASPRRTKNNSIAKSATPTSNIKVIDWTFGVERIGNCKLANENLLKIVNCKLKITPVRSAQ